LWRKSKSQAPRSEFRLNGFWVLLPVSRLPSHGLRVRAIRGRSRSLGHLEAALRALPRPVIGRIAAKALWLDLRCLEAADEAEFAAQWDELPPP